MDSLKQSLREREGHLRKVIKSLSHLSMIDTKEVRKDVQKRLNSKNANRMKFEVEQDRLLRRKQKKNLPYLLQAFKIYDKKMNKVQSLMQKQIESQASLKKVNFQFRKLQLKKQKILRKQRSSGQRYKSAANLDSLIVDEEEMKKNHFSGIFEKGTLREMTEKEQKEEAVVNRLKTTVKSSRKHLQAVYQTQRSNMFSADGVSRRLNPQLTPQASAIKIDDCSFISDKPQFPQNGDHEFLKTQSVFGTPKEVVAKRKSLIDLIRMSVSRQQNRRERVDEKLTEKEASEYNAVQETIETLRKHIDHGNKLKQSLAFNGLKKLLYGDRKGRFIQDNAFKTRLKGECSQHYLNILKKQENLLKNFQGSYLNRRNLAEKFADILGTVNRSARPNRRDQFFMKTDGEDQY